MTGPERVTSLMRLGYTECQARFLVLAALHGGYFLCRQFTAFSKSGRGRTTATFLHAVLSRNHAIGSRISSHAYVYHVTAGALYTALGEPGNRNGRLHELGPIRRRLIGLDFVLSRQDWTFLATEREQMAFFLHEQHVPHAALPFPQHASTNEPLTATTRYPPNSPRRGQVAVAPDRSAIALAYLDDADRTDAGFACFLRRHAQLCQGLSIPVEIVFVTAADGRLELAERAFAKTFGPSAAAPTPGDSALESDVLAYVRARQRYEQDDLGGLQQRELDAMRADLHRVVGTVADEWYRCWQAGGDTALRASLSARSTRDQHSRVRLLVHRVPFDYRPLGMWKGAWC